MDNIRIGNTFEVSWAINQFNGTVSVPYDLAGKDLTLILANALSKVRVEKFSVIGNIISFTFEGKDQRHAGKYSLILIENNGVDGMHIVDVCDAFRLVNRSCETCDDPSSIVDCTHIDFASTMLSRRGISAYEYAKLNGYEGTEEEYAAECRAIPELKDQVQEIVDKAAEDIQAAIESFDKTLQGKQDAIEDLETIRSGAARGATAAQPSDIPKRLPNPLALNYSINGMSGVYTGEYSVYWPSIYAPTSSGAAGYVVEGGNTEVKWTKLSTINGQSLLGGGNIEIEGGEGSLDSEVVSSTEASEEFPQVLYVEQTLTEAQKSQARKNIGADNTELKEQITELTELKDDLYSGYYTEHDLTFNEVLRDTGISVSASTIRCSDFLPIPNDAEILRYNLCANDVLLCLYDADKIFIDCVPVVNSSKLTEGEVSLKNYSASYFRFNCKIDFIDGCYARFDKVVRKKDIHQLEDKFEQQVTELRDDLYGGYYTEHDLTFNEVLRDTGISVSASTIRCSDFLPIPNDAEILKYNLCANDVLLCLYDADKIFIDCVPVVNSSKLTEGEVSLKNYSASYFRFNCKIDFIDGCYAKVLKGAGGYEEDVALNAKDYGAVGDGMSDDTNALEQLFADAYKQQRPIYIPKGTYMIRRSLPIKSNLHIYGEGENSVIKKFPSVWSPVTKDIAEGDTTIFVESVSGFQVGSQVFITQGTNKTEVAARHCSIGVIEVVNADNNSITFRSSYEGIKTGAIKSQSKGCYISTSCALLRSWSMFSAAINVRIHDITLDGNRQEGEPMEWFNAPIHFDPDDKTELYGIAYKFSSYNHTIRDCYCINSSFDGISEQGSSQCVIDNVTISNCAMHGVHFGTSFYNGKVLNCNINGNKERGAAIFFCASVRDVIVSNNMINNYYRGASDEEYATEGTDVIITGNILNNITDIAFNFVKASEERIGGRHIISNNLLRDIGTLFKGDHLRNVTIANNVIEGVTQSEAPLISLTQSEYATIIGNVWNGQMSNTIDLTDTSKVANVNNTWNL